jgi:hypothetical protein
MSLCLHGHEGKMEHPGKAHRHHAKLASSTRGRMRIKIHRQDRSPALLQHVKRHLEAQTGVGTVTVNEATGSVTIPYDHTQQDREDIFRVLKDLDVVIEETFHPPKVDDAIAETSGTGAGLPVAVEDLNRYIRRTIGVPVDLKVLLPLGLVGAGLWSIARRGLLIDTVPGWVYLWLAFDAFVKLHPSTVSPQDAARGEAQ